jgi:hypothetical protein
MPQCELHGTLKRDGLQLTPGRIKHKGEHFLQRPIALVNLDHELNEIHDIRTLRRYDPNWHNITKVEQAQLIYHNSAMHFLENSITEQQAM